MNHSSVKRALAALLCALTLLSCVSVGASAAAKKSIKKCSFTIAASVTYTGKARKPAVIVKDGETVLKKGADYTLAYQNNKKIGVAAVTVTAKKGGAYTGAKTLKFKIVPAKAKNLAAAKTAATAVKLKWSAVKGAAGYAVYTYDKAAKAYTRVKTAAKATATVKNLAASTRYRFAVRAYAKVNGKTVWGPYSKLLTVKTAAAPAAKASRLEKYKKILETGTYRITFTTTDKELGDMPVTFATKKGNIVVDSKIQGIKIKLLYAAREKKTYILLDAMRIYSELPPDFMEDQTLDMGEMLGSFAGSIDTASLKASTVKKNGKTYHCESAVAPDGSETRYFFDGDKLVQIDSVNADGSVESTFITEFSGSVPDSMFQIPKNYRYLSMDWLFSLAA